MFSCVVVFSYACLLSGGGLSQVLLRCWCFLPGAFSQGGPFPVMFSVVAVFSLVLMRGAFRQMLLPGHVVSLVFLCSGFLSGVLE